MKVIMVDSVKQLQPYFGKLDYTISTIPYAYDVSNYVSCMKTYGSFTLVGQPIGGKLTIDNGIFMFSRVNYNSSLIGGIPETQEVMDHFALNKIYPQIEVIDAKEINDVLDKLVNKQARYRYVIDMATIWQCY